MIDPLVTVRRLIALALGSSNVEESRTAALAAVQLIGKYKLLDAKGGDWKIPDGPSSPSSIWDEWQEVARAHEAREKRDRAQRDDEQQQRHRQDREAYERAMREEELRQRRQAEVDESRRADRGANARSSSFYDHGPRAGRPMGGVRFDGWDMADLIDEINRMRGKPPPRPAQPEPPPRPARPPRPPAPPPKPCPLPPGGHWHTSPSSRTCGACAGHVPQGERHYMDRDGIVFCNRHEQEPGVLYPPKFGRWVKLAPHQIGVCECCRETLNGHAGECVYQGDEGFVLWCMPCQHVTIPPCT